MWTFLNLFLLHPLSLSVSVHRFSQEGSDNRGERLLHTILHYLSVSPVSAAFFLSFPVLALCMVQFHMLSDEKISVVPTVYHIHLPFLSLWKMPSPFGAAHEKKIGHRRVDASGETTYKKVGFSSSSFASRTVCRFARRHDFINYVPPTLYSVVLFLCSPPPDCLLCLARGHPAGDWIHCRQPQLQAWERCADAGLLRGGKHLLSQVCLYDSRGVFMCTCFASI